MPRTQPGRAAGPRPGYGRAVPVLAAAFCPHPPLLVPELAGGAAGELDALRAACDEAVEAIAGYGVPVLALGPGATTQTYGPEAGGTFRPWGVDVPAGGQAGPHLPLSLTVGAWLLDRAGVSLDRRRYVAIADTDGAADPAPRSDGDEVLLVMADGSSSRTTKAPRGLHEAAEAYDAAVVAALASGDPGGLAAAAEPSLSRAVGAGGAGAWRAAVHLLVGRRPTRSRLLAAEAPYGVGCAVAVWTW